MAENRAVWGIDIGQAGLKAIRLRYAEAAGQVIAVAFDYVPHPKLLSQPDAIPEELIPQALEKFLSRNDVAGDAVAVSVPGHSALTRFIQLPPVESGKVAEIVKYEARQQIPFALEDVIWDYQVLAGGKEESGYLMGAEVGLFAMKRDQVAQYLRPLTEAKVEVDLIQIAPLALYNVLVYDQLGYRPGRPMPGTDEFTIMLDMGADNTTLLVSNGEKIWIRNVPIGGNNFTRALTKEMKLTFAKAEHLKCNATKSDDPRAVFQALRPVFNDYVSEIQRSVGYFSSVNREAKVAKVIGFGNGFKLAGLQKFLQQNLQYPVERADSFQSLVGDNVTGAPLFEENILTFAVPYGLALQLHGLTPIHTSLLPPEIVTARKIRQKKPWAVAAAAALLLGMSLSAMGAAGVWRSVNDDRFGDAIGRQQALASQVQTDQGNYDRAVNEYNQLVAASKRLMAPLESREYWPALYKAVNECLPPDDRDLDTISLAERDWLKIRRMTVNRLPDLSMWYLSADVQDMLSTMRPIDRSKPPEGDGFIVTLDGVHYKGDPYVKGTLLKNLQQWIVAREGRETPVRQMGITHAVLIYERTPIEKRYNPDGPQSSGNSSGTRTPAGPAFVPDSGAAQQGQTSGEPRSYWETEFQVQFIWRPTPQQRQRVFGLLHDLFRGNPNATIAQARAAARQQGLTAPITEEDFNAYLALHGPAAAGGTVP